MKNQFEREEEFSGLNEEYDLIEFWRDNLPEGQSVKMPRLIKGLPTDYVLGFPEEVNLFDAVTITRRHLEIMTNKEVVEFIHSHTHTIN